MRRDGVTARWNWRTPLAKAVYWVGGMLSKVKYPQHSYTIDWDEWNEYDYDDPPWRMVKSDRRTWQSVGWAWDLLGLSERIDPAHWEHWAIDHDAPTLDGSVCAACPECGGGTCEDHVSPVTPCCVCECEHRHSTEDPPLGRDRNYCIQCKWCACREHPVTGNACTHPDAWFDRVLCEEPCGTMHMICTECGVPTDPCAHVTDDT